MTDLNNTKFSAAAAAWDSNPDVLRASNLAFQSLLEHIPPLSTQKVNGDSGLDVLEIGCGTGLLSLLVAPHVRSLTAVDAAEGMVMALKLKLENNPEVANVLPVHATLEDPDDSRIQTDPLSLRAEITGPRRFDLILSHLVLHHIPSLEDIFKTMFGCLESGGMIALTDFEDFGPEAKRFHPEDKMEGVERHGIPRKGAELLLKAAGFVDVKIQTAFEMSKKVEEVPVEGLGEGKEEDMVFPFLILLGTKP